MFHHLDEINRKKLYRLNVVMKLFKKYKNEVGIQNAFNISSKKFDRDKTGRSINRFFKHVQVL